MLPQAEEKPKPQRKRQRKPPANSKAKKANLAQTPAAPANPPPFQGNQNIQPGVQPSILLKFTLKGFSSPEWVTTITRWWSSGSLRWWETISARKMSDRSLGLKMLSTIRTLCRYEEVVEKPQQKCVRFPDATAAAATAPTSDGTDRPRDASSWSPNGGTPDGKWSCDYTGDGPRRPDASKRLHATSSAPTNWATHQWDSAR